MRPFSFEPGRRQQARRAQDRAYVQDRHKEVRETRLKGLEEDDAAQAETALHVDGELPEHDRHPDPPPQQYHPHEDDADKTSADEDDDDAAEAQASTKPIIYGPPVHPNPTAPSPIAPHQLDVKA